MNVNTPRGENAVLILHNLRSAHNVGSIFRTADGAGVSKVYLVGTTPAPIDRFGRPQPDIAKTALGAEKTVPWEHSADISDVIQQLRADGRQIVAIEQSPASIDDRTLPNDKPLALLFGNEVDGIPEDVLTQSDVIAEIPMHGNKESLNVAVAAGIVLFR